MDLNTHLSHPQLLETESLFPSIGCISFGIIDNIFSTPSWFHLPIILFNYWEGKAPNILEIIWVDNFGIFNPN